MTANQITLIIFIIKLDYLCRKFLNENPFKYYTISSLSHLVSLGLFPLSPPPPPHPSLSHWLFCTIQTVAMSAKPICVTCPSIVLQMAMHLNEIAFISIT